MKRKHAHSFVCRVRNLSRQTECFPKAAAGFIFNIHQEKSPKNFWRGKESAPKKRSSRRLIGSPFLSIMIQARKLKVRVPNEPVGNSRRFPIGATKKNTLAKNDDCSSNHASIFSRRETHFQFLFYSFSLYIF